MINSNDEWWNILQFVYVSGTNMSCPARKFKMKNLQRAVADLSIVVPVKEVKWFLGFWSFGCWLWKQRCNDDDDAGHGYDVEI